MSAGYEPKSTGLVVEDPSASLPGVPERVRIEIGPGRFSGMVVGPDHPYVLDCWAAVVGPTAVLLLVRLHQLVGLEVDTRAVAVSVALGGTDWQARLAWCLRKLSRYRLISDAGTVIALSPAIRVLAEPELAAAGDLVGGLHAAHLTRSRPQRRQPDRTPRTAWRRGVGE